MNEKNFENVIIGFTLIIIFSLVAMGAIKVTELCCTADIQIEQLKNARYETISEAIQENDTTSAPAVPDETDAGYRERMEKAVQKLDKVKESLEDQQKRLEGLSLPGRG